MRAPYQSGSVTSREAAESVEHLTDSWRQTVLLFVRSAGDDGVTCHEIEHDLHLGGNTVRPRLVELERLGLVKKSAATRRTPSGRRARVYVAVAGLLPPPCSSAVVPSRREQALAGMSLHGMLARMQMLDPLYEIPEYVVTTVEWLRNRGKR